jgi:lysophospholipase L1-like esterase
MLARGIVGLLVVLLTMPLAAAADAEPKTDKPAKPWHELADGDRVVFIGGTFIEREGNYGWLETLLTVANAPKKVTFRNLGWSGDTVWGESRAYFGKPPEGYKNLLALVAELKPTVIYLNYGNNEAHAGEAGLEAFTKQYNKLLDDLTKIGNPRIVVLAPLPYEAGFSGFDPAEYNKKLEQYQKAIFELTDNRMTELVNFWLDRLSQVKLTYDGTHYDGTGYRKLLEYFFYDGKVLLPDEDDDKLRTLILAKNELFFHRWRPANTTYLTGFRKHEQGQNAKEIAQFDPLVAAKEEEIRKLLAPAKP